MPPKAVPPCLKPIQGYLLRADEVEGKDPIVAYYARMYALNRAVAEKLADRSGPGMPVLLELMDRLEKDKKSLATEEAMSNNMLAQAHVENFILNIFTYADNEDRAGRINKKIARCFLMSYQLFETLKTFDPELSPDIEEKMRYSKVKAAYITRCLRTGETPQPGPFGESDDSPADDGPGPAPDLGTPPGGFDTLPSASGSLDEQDAYARQLQQEEYERAHRLEVQQEQDRALQQQLQQQQFQQQQQQLQHQQLQQQRLQQQQLQQHQQQQEQVQQQQQRMAATSISQPQATPRGGGHSIGQKLVNPNPGSDKQGKAAKALKFASSALMYDDFETTIKFLMECYDLLTL